MTTADTTEKTSAAIARLQARTCPSKDAKDPRPCCPDCSHPNSLPCSSCGMLAPVYKLRVAEEVCVGAAEGGIRALFGALRAPMTTGKPDLVSAFLSGVAIGGTRKILELDRETHPAPVSVSSTTAKRAHAAIVRAERLTKKPPRKRRSP